MPSGGAFDSSPEVLGETAVAPQPCEGAFDHPLAGQDFEALCAVGSLDDLERPFADFGQRRAELVPPSANT